MSFVKILIILTAAIPQLTLTADCIPSELCNRVWETNRPCCVDCGTHRQEISRIYGGEEAKLGEFPWMVLIYYQKLNRSECSGSLINDRFVLTAAHCISPKSIWAAGRPTRVRLGEHDIRSDIDCERIEHEVQCAPRAIDIRVEKLILHPEYKEGSTSQENDIGLIKLRDRVRFNEHIRPVCLPSNNKDVEIGTHLTIAGWGKTPEASSNPTKLKTTVPIASHSECEMVFKSLKLKLNSETQICAGGEDGKDSCRGDSGGPLMQYDSTTSRWNIYGIVSMGSRTCGKKGFPAIYTKVGPFLNWINATIGGLE